MVIVTEITIIVALSIVLVTVLCIAFAGWKYYKKSNGKVFPLLSISLIYIYIYVCMYIRTNVHICNVCMYVCTLGLSDCVNFDITIIVIKTSRFSISYIRFITNMHAY